MTVKTISRIMKVNHAGEYGAIRIYQAQLLVAKSLHHPLIPFLEETLSHEISHAQKFKQAMEERVTKPCGAMPLWGIGGWLLGFATALMGKNAVMVCTEAVELTVHRHLEEQIVYLEKRDSNLQRLIIEIQQEEKSHLEYAQQRVQHNKATKLLFGLISVSTEIVIWLSTQGDVTRMQKSISRQD